MKVLALSLFLFLTVAVSAQTATFASVDSRNAVAMTTPYVVGTLYYQNAGSGVYTVGIGNATVCAYQGVRHWCVESNSDDGAYTISGFASSGPVTIYASHNDELTGTAIVSYDCARIAAHIANTIPFTNDYQRVSGDINSDGQIDSTDTTQCGNFVASLPSTGDAGKWRFFQDGYPTFPVGSSPTYYYFSSIPYPVDGVNFTGILVGDPGGDWNN